MKTVWNSKMVNLVGLGVFLLSVLMSTSYKREGKAELIQIVKDSVTASFAKDSVALNHEVSNLSGDIDTLTIKYLMKTQCFDTLRLDSTTLVMIPKSYIKIVKEKLDEIQ